MKTLLASDKENMRFCTSFVLILTVMLTTPAFAGIDQLSFQGRILKTDGTPFEYHNVSFLFEITNPAGNCVIYREQKNGVNMTGSSGVFDVPIGSGSKMFPTSATVGLMKIFSNSQDLDCADADNNVAGTYTPAATHGRLLFVQFHDGSGWKKISPETEIRAVPYAGYATAAESANTLNGKTAADFIAKTLIPTCPANTFLTYSGGTFTCAGVTGASGGTVTDVASGNSYLTIINGTTTPTLTVNVGTGANTVAAGNDARFGNALKIQGVDVAATAPTSSQYLKYNGSQWVPATIVTGDVSGLSGTLSGLMTQSTFNSAVSSANCGQHQTMYWNSVSSSFQCQAINVSVAGDVSGSIGAASVDKIKGVAVDATAPSTGQVLKYDGTKWAPAADTSNSGTVTSVSGTAGQVSVATGTSTPVISLANVGTAGTYYKVTTDAQGRVTSGSASLVASDIPSLDFTKITSGLPTTLTGYGITDAVKNLGGTPGFKSGTNATKGAASTAGNIYIATDTKEIYRDNGTTWDLVGSASGTGGTITAVTAGTGLTGGGSTGSVSLAVNAGIGANQIVQLDASSKLPAVDGSALTNLNPSALSAVVPISKGGTGQSTQTAGFNALSPLTTKGDIVTRDATDSIRLAVGTNGQVLSADSTQASGLKWMTPSAGTVTSVTATAPLSVATGTTTPAISISSGSGNAQVLRWNTTDWSASYLNFADLKSSAGLTQIPNNCTSSQTLVWQTPSDTFACTTISVSGSNFATQSAGLVFAGPTSGSAAPTFRALASTDLPSGTLTGSGTTGYIPYYSAASTLTNSPLYTDGTNIGMGQTTLSRLIDIKFAAAGASNGFQAYNTDSTGSSSITLKAGTNSVYLGVWGTTAGSSSTYLQSTSTNTFDISTFQAQPLTFSTNKSAGGTTERMRILSTGAVGIGTTTPTSLLTVKGGALFGDKSTFPSDFNTIEANTYSNSLYNNTATSGTFGAFGSWMRVTPASNSTLAAQAVSAGLSFNVPSGVTVTSNSEALWVSATRNRYASNTDNGTVSTLRGATINYGHDSFVASVTPATTNAYGIVINPNSATGTITNMYDIYLGSKSAGGTVTNRYGLYQSDSSADNVFMGNIAINKTNPTANLDVNGSIRADGGANISMRASTASLYDSGDIVFSNSDDTEKARIHAGGAATPVMYFSVGSPTSTKMTILNTGSVGIGTVSPSYTLHVVGTAGLSTGTAWTNASDIRLKDIHGDYEYGLNEVLQLHTVRYNYKKNNALGLPSDFEKTGFIAQEVQKVIPDAVKKRDDGYLELNVDPIHWAVVNAIKDFYHKWFNDSAEIHTQLSQQQREIASLKEQNKSLRNQVEEISNVKKALCAKDKSLDFCLK
ncbi:MAG: tail fiber domain-containing protein [Bdellovibrio sp.]|nr:tail fiber domain-containing protein [Bdellovibrio sp.]